MQVMASYSSFQGTKCHASYSLLTELLKRELNFDGLLSSDYSAIEQLGMGSLALNIALALDAGIDMVMMFGNANGMQYVEVLLTLTIPLPLIFLNLTLTHCLGDIGLAVLMSKKPIPVLNPVVN